MYSSTSALALALPVYGYHFNCGFAGSDILRSILVYRFFDRMLGFTRNSVILCQPPWFTGSASPNHTLWLPDVVTPTPI